jgi:hypothetical protein
VIDWGPALLLLTALSGTPETASPADPIHFAQVMVREQILIRVPANLRQSARPVAPHVEWKEKRGPKCVSMRLIAGATLLSQNSVDLIFRDSSRIRAKLERSCPALDYYHGFYLSPTKDGQICADRDSIRSRMGGQCGIEKFKTLRADASD